eukprot:10062247-Prorocentrum_lima.AAC.1
MPNTVGNCSAAWAAGYQGVCRQQGDLFHSMEGALLPYSVQWLSGAHSVSVDQVVWAQNYTSADLELHIHGSFGRIALSL